VAYLYPYTSQWPEDYRQEALAIGAAYVGAIELYHIGSTAIEGLFAKDCIDILGVVPDLTQVQANVKSLEHLGFNYKSSYGIEGREYFSKDARKVHFHIFQQGNASIKKHLGFVQIMKSRPDLIDQLNRLKLELESKYPFDKHCYQQEKTFFYDEVHKMLY